MRRLLGVRPEDGREVWLGFVTLLMVIAAHAILETARDSLFLTDLPVNRLPWAYLGIAVLAFGVARLSGRLLTARSPRRVLALLLLGGAVGTAVFWRLVATAATSALMALYIWTGLLASAVVMQFWVQLGNRMHVGQARRAYAVIAAGGMLGATLGSLLATGMLTFAAPRALLLLSAAMFALAACLPAFVADDPVPTEAVPTTVPAAEAERPGLRAIWADQYLRRILFLAVLAPLVAMAVDFIFKSAVTHSVARGHLGPFFARYNTIVNGAALVFQLTLAPRLLQSMGVVGSLCLLPGTLGLVAIGVAATTALPAALVLRGTDGILRHSLHRAATEILFVPLPAATRSALRGLAESIGQRGGQVVGSILILLAVALGATPRELAGAVAVLCGLWLFGYLRLQNHYVDRFRTQLRALGTGHDPTVPELDLRSLETLVATLSAPHDAEVLAAMDVLASFGRTHLVSPLVLYHPSSAVVLRALALFEGVGREDVQEIRRRLLEHADPCVRAGALRGMAAGGYDRAVVRTVLRRDASPMVRFTALTIWTGLHETPPGELDEAVADLVSLPDLESRLAVASTLRELPAAMQVPVARALLRDATPTIRRQVARTLATDPDASRISLLTELIPLPECREAARAGLVALGAPALEYAAQELASVETPASLRRHLPRTISRFASERAAEILVAQLAREADGRVAYKILRGLGRMRANDPELPVDRPTLLIEAERTLHRLLELLAYRVAYEQQVAQPDAGDLLGALLLEKEQRALERVFRILQILETSEDFAAMFTALSADTPAARASARELIGHVLDGRLRDALLALTDSLPAAERLQEATRALPLPVAEIALVAGRSGAPHPSAADALAEVIAAMCADRSVTLSALARHELGGRMAETPRVAS